MQMFSRGILINSIIFVVRLPNLLSYLDCAIYLGQKLNYNKQFKNEFIGRIVEYTAMAGRIASASIKAVVGHKKSIKAALTLTPSAVQQLKKILSGKSDCIGLKIGVKQRGCNGLSYTLDYANEKHKLDEEVIQDGIRVFIDRKAQLTLLGTEMDFVQSKLSAEFIFYNPNIKGTCGCGESFNI